MFSFRYNVYMCKYIRQWAEADLGYKKEGEDCQANVC